ncbi:MAG: GntR family transcriptional regulator [Acidimicrobiia bacterium]
MPASLTDRLRAEILAGRLPPGERLIELQLTERFHEGRAAIRSALVELEKEGLVVREVNRGATVRRVSITEAIQITEARAAVESLVARHAARNATDADRDELRRIVADMRATVADGQLLAYSNLNATLHQRLREISDHAVANELVRNLRDRAASHQFRLALMPGRAEESLPQHAAIVEAVVAGDEDAAAVAMHAHLESVIGVLRHWEELGIPV